MRILIYHEALYDKNHKYNDILEETLKRIKTLKRVYIEEIENFDEFETAILTRSYSFIITSKIYNKLNINKYINNLFFTSVMVLDENLKDFEKKNLYEEKKINYLIELNKYSKEEVLHKIFGIKLLSQAKIFQFFEFAINVEEKKIYINKELNKDIRGKMFDIFLFLVLNNGVTYSKEEIINAVFEEPEKINESSVDTYLSTLKTHVNNLTDRFKMNVINKEGYNISLNTIRGRKHKS